MITKKRKCLKCGKEGFGKIHNHHINYNPEKTVFLCKKDHGIISSLDSYSRAFYRKIFKRKLRMRSEDDNILRNLIFSHFIETDRNLSGRRMRKEYTKEILCRLL